MLKDLLLFALLPACCGALAVGATLVLPGGGDAAAPRDLFSACLINGIAAFTLPGVIQVWFTMGETRRAKQAEEHAERERELLVLAQQRADRDRELLVVAQERADRERELLAVAQERADRERELLAVAQERADRERERARQAESELADTRVQMAELVAVVTDLRRRLDERDNGSGAH